MDSSKNVVIVGISARSLVQAARRSGFAPLAIDFFADHDLRLAASDWRKMPGSIDAGFCENLLIEALDGLTTGLQGGVTGVVYGAGFEARPHLLELMASRWNLIGNSAEVVRRVKDPHLFFDELTQNKIAHPRWQLRAPSCSEGWLFKKLGGAGGQHVVEVCARRTDAGYYQKHEEGDPVSALVLADGENAIIVGLSDQWTSPTAKAQMRWGGAVRPSSVDSDMDELLSNVACEISKLFGLKGLNSVDFLVHRDRYHVLEVNPRPGATVDIYDRRSVNLFNWHVSACNGTLPKSLPSGDGSCAIQTVYASQDLQLSASMDWPTWCADIPYGEELIVQHAPLCSVIAEGHDPGATKNTAVDYSHKVLDALLTKRCISL